MDIVKSLAVLIMLSILYSIFIAVVHIENFQPLNQFQGNTIAKEELLYADMSKKTCFLTGSSLTYRIKEQFLPSEYQNMAIAGSSSSYGIRKIIERGIVPDILVIETNLLRRTKDKQDNENFQDRDKQYLPIKLMKLYLPITQQKNQPVGMAINLLSQLFLKNKNTTTAIKSDRARQIMAERQQEVYAEKIKENEQTRKFIEDYHTMIDGLVKKGTCVVFMEMPVTCALVETNLAKSTREIYYKTFPPEQYQYITLPTCQEIETTDGIHLSVESAKLVARHIVSELDKIDCK